MEIRCSYRIAARTIIAAFLAGAAIGAALTGYSLNAASRQETHSSVALTDIHLDQEPAWRDRIIGGINATAGPAR